MVADQVTKHVVTSTLALDESVHVVGPLSIHHVQNSGHRVRSLRRRDGDRHARHRPPRSSGWSSSSPAPVRATRCCPRRSGCSIGGSLSNLVDRIRLHHVTDFIDLGWWPAFNLADSFIVIGVAILLAGLVAADRTAAAAAAHARRRRPVKVPPEAAGERLDRFLATQLGSRAAAERAVDAGALVDGVARVEELSPARRRGGRDRGPCPARAGRRRRSRASSGRTSTCSWSTSRRGSSSTQAPGTQSGTLVDALAGKVAGGDPERPGRRAPPRPRHVGPDRARAVRGGARARSSELVRERAFERTYLALVRGRPRSRTGRIEAPIGRDRGDPTRSLARHRHAARRGRRTSRSSELWPEYALLRVRLETGRMHQIRVHLAAVDLPVVGDPIYGVREPPLERQFLHATALAFPHPFTGERIETVSELPPDLAAFLATCPDAAVRERAATMRCPLSLEPAGNPRWTVVGSSCRFPPRPAGVSASKPERGFDARRLHEGPPGGRSSLRSSDPPLEPEDEALHLHRARRHLHHRPHPDAGAAGRGVQLCQGDLRARRLGPLRRHEEAGAGRRSRRGAARRHAVREPPLARRPAHQLAHDLRPHPAPARAARAEAGGAARAAPGQGAHLDGGRAREARGEPRRRRRHAPPARGRLHRRPAQGTARGARGTPPRPAGDRARRHELRPGRSAVRDPGQRRRDPLVHGRDQGDRRRDRSREEEGQRERAQGPQGRSRSRAAAGGRGRGAEADAAAELPERGRADRRLRPSRRPLPRPSRAAEEETA